jgi:hypothetical protein
MFVSLQSLQKSIHEVWTYSLEPQIHAQMTGLWVAGRVAGVVEA